MESTYHIYNAFASPSLSYWYMKTIDRGRVVVVRLSSGKQLFWHFASKVLKRTRLVPSNSSTNGVDGSTNCSTNGVDGRAMDFGSCVQGIRGVLVRLTTCKRLTNSLPKLNLITLPPPETAR